MTAMSSIRHTLWFYSGKWAVYLDVESIKDLKKTHQNLQRLNDSYLARAEIFPSV